MLAGALAIPGWACPAAEYLLIVELKTDLEPGADFVVIRTDTAPSGESFQQAAVATLTGSDDFLQGERVAEIESVRLGLHRVRVNLLAPDGHILVDRTVSVEVRGTTSVTVVLTRRCVDVVCPRPGDTPNATTCADGRCISPDCVADAGVACGAPVCATDAECAAAACADVSCAIEACLVRPRDSRCGDGERCDVTRGCVPDAVSCAPEGSDCDDGDPCTSADLCTDGTCAGTPYECTPAACQTSTCDGVGGCVVDAAPACCGNGACDAAAGESCSTCPTDCGGPVRVCDSCRRWDCQTVLGSVTRYDADCSTCTPCDACAMGASCYTCPHPKGGDCRFDTQETNVRYEDCNCRDECP